MDLKIVESLNGGELVMKTKDLTVIEGFGNMPYLAMFGGNVAASTPNKRLETEQAFDWWGNSLLMPNQPGLQFNSLTERNLRDIPLSSFGRTLIEQGVKEDLRFMREFCKVGVAVSIEGIDKVIIGVALIEPDNLQRREFIYIWDATKNELNLVDAVSGQARATSVIGFDYNLDFSFDE